MSPWFKNNFRRLRLLPILALLVSLAPTSVVAQKLALVVGNAEYAGINYELANPVNDATALGKKLTKLGFDVTLLTDAASASFWPELTKFTDAAEGAETVLFFFAGHAFQLGGTNYLVPNDAELKTREAITTETWDLDAIIARLNAPGRQTLVFLDACRNNPLPENIRQENQGRRGLARLQTGRGTFVAFATEPNSVTYDGDEEGGNSPFTKAILENIETPGISISDMMIRVRNQVQEQTFERQYPWDQSSLNAQFYFKQPKRLKENGFGTAEMELLAALPEDKRAAFLALLTENNITTNFDEDDIVETIIIKGASRPEGGKPLLSIAGLESENTEGLIPDRPNAVDTESIAGSDVEIADGVQVANLGNAARAGTAAPFADVQRTGPSRVVGLTQAVEIQNGIIVPARERVRGGIFNTLDIAATSGVAIPSDSIVGPSTWVLGLELANTSDEARRILNEVYGGALEITEDGDVIPLDPKVIKTSVQSELARLGCYRLKVDGDWGKGSRTAAARYFAAKQIVPDSLEATPELLRRLEFEENVVCQNSVAKNRQVAERFEEEVEEAPKRRIILNNSSESGEGGTSKKLGLTPGVFR